MKEPQPSRSWRELLEQILQNDQERQRITYQLGVSPVTLTRWVSGQSVPRGPNLRRLLEVLSQHRTDLLALLEQDVPGITASLSKDSLSSQSSGIPFEFYERILHTRASLPHSL